MNGRVLAGDRTAARATTDRGRVPRVSLVCATIGRDAEFSRLLASLDAQQVPIELIVVDQSGDDRLVSVLGCAGPNVEVVHLRCPPGLARARNLGLRRVTGDWVGFPDDDCWYAPQTLQRVIAHFEAHPEADLVSGRFVDADGRGESKWPTRPTRVGRFGVWRCACSITVFARRRVLDAVPGFDESLGVGAGTPFGSGEETDFLLRAMEAGLRIDYDPDLVLRHPLKDDAFDDAAVARARSYATGSGRVLRTHRYPFWFFAASVAVPLAGACWSRLVGDRARARLRGAIAAGRVAGWRAR